MDTNNIEVNEAQQVNFIEVKPFNEANIEAHSGKCGGLRNLKQIPIYTNDGFVFWYLVKRPSMAVMQAIAEAKERGDKKQDIKAITDVQKLMMGCVLEGDKSAYENDGAIYTELCKQIGKMVTEAKSDLKN